MEYGNWLEIKASSTVIIHTQYSWLYIHIHNLKFHITFWLIASKGNTISKGVEGIEQVSFIVNIWREARAESKFSYCHTLLANYTPKFLNIFFFILYQQQQTPSNKMRHAKFISRTVLVKDNNVDKAFRTLNSILGREGILTQFRREKYFEKPFLTRRRVNYERCKAYYSEDMNRKINFVLRANRVDPFPGCS